MGARGTKVEVDFFKESSLVNESPKPDPDVDLPSGNTDVKPDPESKSKAVQPDPEPKTKARKSQRGKKPGSAASQSQQNETDSQCQQSIANDLPEPSQTEDAASEAEVDADPTVDDSSVSEKPKAEKPTPNGFKYPIGSHVYTEYRQILYSATILKTRRKKRAAAEYLVHYGGYKKSSNRWVKEKELHDVDDATTQRYEEQRLIPADILCEAEQSTDVGVPSSRRRNKSNASDNGSVPNSVDSSIQSRKPAADLSRPRPPRRARSDTSDTGQPVLDPIFDSIQPGVAFLVGSMVFVQWSGSLYLAKMLKKRYFGEHTEYFISYDGFDQKHDAWVSIRNIYEVNPPTKRAFKFINAASSGNGEGDKPKSKAPPVSQTRRETRKRKEEVTEVASTRSGSTKRDNPPAAKRTSTIDMEGVEAGVEFLPGSTVFAEYNGGLTHAKMLKKRGRGEFMEYYISYDVTKKKKEEAWVSTNLIYEINPQTKRMFRKFSLQK